MVARPPARHLTVAIPERADVASTASADVLRVVTYNVHSGLGERHAFRKPRAAVEANLRAIAATIAAATPAGVPPDVVALNEVDFAARRSGGFDQADFVAEELAHLTGAAYEVVRGETWRRRIPGFEVRFGNAALVRHPVLAAKACLLDGSAPCGAAYDGSLPPLRSGALLDRLLSEPRGVVTLTIALAGRTIDVLVTHLDAFVLAEREAQAAHLLHRFVQPGHTTVLLGDVNAVPVEMTRTRRFFTHDRTHTILTSGLLLDARGTYAAHHGIASVAAWATFPAGSPLWPLDIVLGSGDLVPVRVAVIGDTASDHRGLVVEYQLGEAASVREVSTQHAEAPGAPDAVR